MGKALGFALLASSIVLIVWADSLSDSTGPDIPHTFATQTADGSLWIFLAGVVAAVVGVRLIRRRHPAKG